MSWLFGVLFVCLLSCPLSLIRFNRSLNVVEAEPEPEEDLSWMTFGLSAAEFEKKMMDRYDSLAKCVLEDHFTTQVSLNPNPGSFSHSCSGMQTTGYVVSYA